MADHSVTVETVFKLRDEGADVARQIRRDAEETVRAVRGESDKINNLFGKVQGRGASLAKEAVSSIAGVSLAAFGVGQAIGLLREFSEHATTAAIAAEDIQDRTAATIWLLKSQDLVQGPRNFADAMVVARQQVNDFYLMAERGIGNPAKYADNWSKLARAVMLAGGTTDDVRELTQVLTGLSSIYGDVPVEATVRLLTGARHMMNADALATLNLTRDQLGALQSSREVLDQIKSAIPALRPIADTAALGLDSRRQRAIDRRERAWAKAGEAWSPIGQSLSEGSATLTEWVGELFDPFRQFAELRNVAAAIEAGQGGFDLYVSTLLDMVGVQNDLAARLSDVTSAVAVTVGAMEGAGYSAEEVAASFLEAETAASELAKYLRLINNSNGFLATHSVPGADLSPDEAALKAATVAQQSGIPAIMLPDALMADLIDLTRGAAAVGVQFENLADLLADPRTRDIAGAVVKLIEQAATPDVLVALQERLGLRKAKLNQAPALSKAPVMHFHGGVVIKMDTRHADPDRVAAAVINNLGRLSRKQIAARADVFE